MSARLTNSGTGNGNDVLYALSRILPRIWRPEKPKLQGAVGAATNSSLPWAAVAQLDPPSEEPIKSIYGGIDDWEIHDVDDAAFEGLRNG